MKAAVVTGATRGIGRAVALSLATGGYHVFAAGRPGKRMEAAVSELGGAGGRATPIELDLASLDSTRNAARAIVDAAPGIDVLVNCAGVGPTTRGITDDGFEIHFGVNHLGHFSFTHHLGPGFGPGSRIVQVTSSLHDVDGVDFARLRRKTRTPTGIFEYSTSKLANILFVRELARRRPELRAYAVHPGLTDTDIIPWYVKPFVARRLIAPTQASTTVVWCATSPDLGHESGGYYARMAAARPRASATNDELAAQLWEQSEVWCGIAGRDG